jgi:hypothetical protein
VVLSAFLRRHGDEGGSLLLQVFTATLRTLDLVLFVFRKGKEEIKWLLAIFAIELIARHMDLRKRQRGGLYSTCTLRERLCQGKSSLTEEPCQTAIIMRYKRRESSGEKRWWILVSDNGVKT